MHKNTTSLHPNIAAHIPTLKAVVELLHPYAEGAVHDLKNGTIAALYNNISRREVGDPSAITELGVDVKDFPAVFDPYYKTNWDGKKLKCTSVTVRDETGAPIGLICLNFDTSVFSAMNTQLESFLTLKNQVAQNPVETFSNNWQQQVSAFIDDYTHRHNMALSAMTKDEKSELVKQMYDHGLFNYRDAAAYVASLLGVSRTTVYNYLKEGDK